MQTAPKTFVFVLMPFNADFDDIYALGIKSAADTSGCYCERVDEQYFQGTILERIYNQIQKADVIVADMTGRNPNVFYEVGYAHALGKRVILLTQCSDDIPFDLKHFPHIVYERRITFLQEELRKRLDWCRNNPEGSLLQADVNLCFYLAGRKIADFSRVELPVPDKDEFYIKLDIHNPTDTVIEGGMFRVGLTTPFTYPRSKSRGRAIETSFMASEKTTYDHKNRVVSPTEQTVLHMSDLLDAIFPNAWDSIQFHLYRDKKFPFQLNESEDFSVNLFTKLGRKDFAFSVLYRRPNQKTEPNRVPRSS